MSGLLLPPAAAGDVADGGDTGLGRLTRLEFWLVRPGGEEMGGDVGEQGDTGDTAALGSGGVGCRCGYWYWCGYGCCWVPVYMPRRPISGGRGDVEIRGRWAALLLYRESGSLGVVVTTVGLLAVVVALAALAAPVSIRVGGGALAVACGRGPICVSTAGRGSG